MMNRDTARQVVQELLNDVIEQGFHHLLRHPQQGDGLNQIIKDATDELNQQLARIDDQSIPNQPLPQAQHFKLVIAETENRSLYLLSRLQKIQQLDNPRLKRV
jgi:stress-induced morphogen